MLNCLHIENIAVIERADIDFSNGFNVLTGETGAGKSIIIDSINAVLGARTSKELIRNGTDCARVVAEFSNINKSTVNLLESYGLPYEDDRLIIQRILTFDSRGGFKINSYPVSATVVKEIALQLINIHGQHDNQMLLNPEKHCIFIDNIAENEKELKEYYDEFRNLNSLRRELQSLDEDENEKLKKTDLLKYQISELENSNIKIGEYENLKESLKKAKQFEANSKRLNTALEIISGSENNGIIDELRAAYKSISLIDNKKTEAISDKLSEIIEDITDIESELISFYENDLSAVINIDEIQDRIEILNALMLKYSCDEENLLKYLENAKQQLYNITMSDKRIAELEKQLSLSEQRLIEKGNKLTATRVKAAEFFEKNVCEILKYLDMPNVAFKVKLDKGKYTKNGCDVVEFMISANSGENLKPLAKIASGGELSRIMLAIKSVLSKVDDVSTLIFDEIDSGISGHAATRVAEQLKNVAENKQVICITHLAQIASVADNHLFIEKNVANGRTYTDVLSLNYEQRISEIARIMSGTEITENLFNSAKELLDRSINNANL